MKKGDVVSLPVKETILFRQMVSVDSNGYLCQGLTLLELLVVVALLSIVALASTSLIIDTGEWKRQQVTEDQWLSIKRSIVGDNVVDANYRREYSGFVTDMGRLPRCLRELIRPFDCTPDLTAATRLNAFSQDESSDQWAGWRGPYLGVPGANEYRDGWRNQGRKDNLGNDDDVNYGWLFGTGEINGTACQDAEVAQNQAGSIILQSCGDDGDVDNTETGFAGDFPYVEYDGASVTYIPLITRHDYQVDLGESWINAPVKVKSTTVGSSRIIPADDLRLRINYPVLNGEIPDWSAISDRDVAPFLSATFPVSDTRVVDGAGKVYTGSDTDGDFLTDGPLANVIVPNGTILSGTLMQIPAGLSSTLIFDGGNSILELQNCPCGLEVDAGTLSTATTLSGTSTIAIEPENIAPMSADLGKYVIEVPQAATGTSPIKLPNVKPVSVELQFNRVPTTEYKPKVIWGLAGIQPTVTVTQPFDIEGDLVETDTSKDQFLVPSTSIAVGNVITVEKSVPTVPQGLRNITIVCESDGLLFDGNCSDNTGASAVYTPIATPYQLEVSPRAYVPVPNEITWNVE